MLKLTALILLGLGLGFPLLNHRSLPIVSTSSPTLAQSVGRKLPLNSPIGQAVRQDAIQYWNFPASGRVVQIEFQDARSRFKSDLANVRIMTVEIATECYRTPTDNPTLPCPVQIPGGWKITVTDFQKQWIYHVNSAGNIQSVTVA
jgi:hypothetical protein